MNIFRNLVSFEYKKIFKKKSTLIVLLLTIILAAVSVYGTVIGNAYDRDGNVVSSKYDYLIEERDFARMMSGRKIDTDIIMEAVEAFARAPQNPDDYFNEDNARRYYSVFEFASSVLDTNSKEFSQLTPERVSEFYQIRSLEQEAYINKTDMSDKAKQTVLSRDAQIITPITYEYYGGYQRYLTIMYTTGILATAAIAIIFAPIFSGEYVSGADNIILSSKNGRGKVIAAKLFVLFSFSIILAVFLAVVSFIECIITWGTDGAQAAIQLFIPMCVHPITFIQSVIVYTLCVVGSCIFTASMTAILSSWIKNPFGTIVIMAVILIAPLFFNVSEYSQLATNLFILLPTNMSSFWNVFSHMPYEFFGAVIPAYIFMPIFSVIISTLISAGAYFKFRSHRIG